MYKDLRDFLETLREKGELVSIKEPVSQDLEISTINDAVVKKMGPALLFENVVGHKTPVAINLFGSYDRMALALGRKSCDELPEVLGQWLRLATEPPLTLAEKIKSIPKLIEMASFIPKTVGDGACKEVIMKGGDVDLNAIPIIKCWPMDAGRFITFPLVFSRDPESGKRNVGTYRMQVIDGKTTLMHFHPHKDAARHYRKAKQKKEKIPFAVAIGSDPFMCFAAVCPLPPDMDEVLFAGFLRKEGTKLVKCETVDLEVPANAEFVLEGYLDPNDERTEGPFGDHTGFYSMPEQFPAFHVTAITHRKNPIYHTIVVGPPPQEDAYIGYAIERIFLPLMKMNIPELVDYHMPFEGCFHNIMIVSIKKQFPGHARKVMHAIWGMGQAMFSKCIIVVDEDVNVHNMREVAWVVGNNIDPERDMEFAMGPMDILDHSSRMPCYGSKVGIDATRKLKEEGFTRPWPPVMKVDEAVCQKVAGIIEKIISKR